MNPKFIYVNEAFRVLENQEPYSLVASLFDYCWDQPFVDSAPPGCRNNLLYSIDHAMKFGFLPQSVMNQFNLENALTMKKLLL
jgi:hypothetical protein